MSEFDAMLTKAKSGKGFIAALDQSGGSTPKALAAYGIKEDQYEKGETSMFDKVHEMRTRIITCPHFNGDSILGAILFEDTMDRTIEGTPTAEYLWKEKKVIPFLKVDKGLVPETNGVQLMKSMPELDALLKRAKAKGVFGTKMRSNINEANEEGIRAVVLQQFEIGRKICAAGLVPILEPEINIHSASKAKCEEIMKDCIKNQLQLLSPDEKIMFKFTLPSEDNFYDDIAANPNVVRIVALSGGYSRAEANEKLARQTNMIASFSRALVEGLSNDQSEEEYNQMLKESIDSIFKASVSE
jgi:fructose-bisphosphate aldolase class I